MSDVFGLLSPLLVVFTAIIVSLFKGFEVKKVSAVFAGEQPTAYGSQEQAGFGIHRRLSLNH